MCATGQKSEAVLKPDNVGDRRIDGDERATNESEEMAHRGLGGIECPIARQTGLHEVDSRDQIVRNIGEGVGIRVQIDQLQ